MSTSAEIKNVMDYVVNNLQEIKWLGDKKPETQTFFQPIFREGANPNAKEFVQLVKAAANKGVHDDMNPFDGIERSYIELGRWMGNQQVAFGFIALSESFGLVKVSTPTYDRYKTDNAGKMEESIIGEIKKEAGRGELTMKPDRHKIAEADPDLAIKFLKHYEKQISYDSVRNELTIRGLKDYKEQEHVIKLLLCVNANLEASYIPKDSLEYTIAGGNEPPVKGILEVGEDKITVINQARETAIILKSKGEINIKGAADLPSMGGIS